MDINEQIFPIVAKGIQWVREKMGTSKKNLEIKISELENQVNILSYGNKIYQEHIALITSIILEKLTQGGEYGVKADTLIQINENAGNVQIVKNREHNQIIDKIKDDNKRTIFDNMDEEIQQCKLLYPSERGEKK